MCQNKVYSRVRIDKHICLTCFLLGMFRNKMFCRHCLFNFALDYAIRRVHISQYGLKVSSKHQLLVYADDVSVLGGSVHTV
jgi:hypothetical protein